MGQHSLPNIDYFRTAAAIRTAAMTCLQALLQIEDNTVDTINELTPDILPKVLHLVDLVCGLSSCCSGAIMLR